MHCLIDRSKLTEALLRMGPSHLRGPYKCQWSPERPYRGFCYVVSEVLYHYLAPKGSKPYCLRINEETTHWFLKDPEGSIIDYTVDELDGQLEYDKARCMPFRTKEISKRGKLLAELLNL